MQGLGLKSRSLKSWIAIVLSSIIIITMTLVIEANLNVYQVEAQKNMFGLVSESRSSDLFVNYNNDKTEELREFDAAEINLPRFIKAQADLTFHAYGNTFVTLSNGADLRVIIFNKNRLHLSLIEGELILDNRLSSIPSSIQVENTLLKPYQRGIYRLSKNNDKIEIESVEGQSLIGMYQDTDLDSKKLLARGQMISFKSDLDIDKFNPVQVQSANISSYVDQGLIIDIDTEAQKQKLFSSVYKGREVQPDDSFSFANRLTKNLTFNSKKREFLSLYPYQQNILNAVDSLKAGAFTKANVLITEANDNLTKELIKNPRSLNSFKMQVNKDYEVIAGLTAHNKLNALKENIEDMYDKYIVVEFYLEHILSLLNDSFILFSKDSNIEAEAKLELVASRLNDSLTNENKGFLIDVIDNLALQNPEANFTTTYTLRQTIYESIPKKSNELADEYRKSTESHLRRLEEYSKSKLISTRKIKESSLVLINSLDSTHQLKYEDFIDELNLQGIQLGF